METKLNANRMRRCSKFNRCSAPKCPLDEFIDERVYVEGDKVCTIEKTVRLRIGKDMLTRGLTKQEIGAEKRLGNAGKEELLQRIQKGPFKAK